MFQILTMIKGTVQPTPLNYKVYQTAQAHYDTIVSSRKSRSLIEIQDDFNKSACFDGADIISVVLNDVGGEIRAAGAMELLKIQIQKALQREFDAMPNLVIAK